MGGWVIMSETNVGVVRDFIMDFWNGGKLDTTDEFLTADYVDHSYDPPNQVGLKNMARILQAAFPDQSSEEESIVTQGDRVIVRLRMRGTHLGSFRGTEATQHPIDVRVYREYRIVEGRIAEHWALFDTATLLRQIGADLHEQPACQMKRQ
jgi:predicted ester cyclase